MSAEDAARERLLRHLLAEEDADRLDFEQAMLDDDEFFNQLAVAETELVERYVGGEIDGAAADRLADLVGSSERLQETAELTLALNAYAPPTSGAIQVQPGRRRRRWPLAAAVAAAGLLVAWVLISQWLELRQARRALDRLEVTQQSLEEDVERLEAEVERLEEERLRQRRRLARGAE
ncbi:MAG: hypothetical protein AAGM22_26310 [Acidobacteriota bacterium]